MNILIVFATKHGCSEKCVNKLKDKLTGEIDTVNLKNSSQINVSNYKTVIIGGSIHAGKIQKKVKKFCQNYLSILIDKRIGLFICCMEEGEKATNQFNEAFPDELIQHASATGIFGGEFNFEKINFIERYIVKKIAKIDKSISKISEKNINKFISQIS